MKGCQKRVIFLKNTGSEIFDEAYFIISRECEREKVGEDSLILEANRIVSASIECEEKKYTPEIFKRMIKSVILFLKKWLNCMENH